MIQIKETTKLKLKELLKLPLLLFIIFFVEYIVLYIITRAEFLPFLQILNANYGNVLTVFVSTLMTGATVVYAYFAYKQYQSDKNEKETKERPVIFPIITNTHGSLQFDYQTLTPYIQKTQRVDIDLSLKNVGKSLATGGLIKASINYETPHEKVTLPLTIDWENFGVLLPDNEEQITLHIYEQDIKKLLDILTKRFELSHPFAKRKYGELAHPTLDIDIIYRNIDEKYFCSNIISEIYWIEDISHPILSRDSLFENTIPPCPLDRNATFKLRMVDSAHSAFSTYPLSNRRVKRMRASWEDSKTIKHTLYLKKNPEIQKLLLQTVPIEENEREKIMEEKKANE